MEINVKKKKKKDRMFAYQPKRCKHEHRGVMENSLQDQNLQALSFFFGTQAQ